MIHNCCWVYRYFPWVFIWCFLIFSINHSLELVHIWDRTEDNVLMKYKIRLINPWIFGFITLSSARIILLVTTFSGSPWLILTVTVVPQSDSILSWIFLSHFSFLFFSMEQSADWLSISSSVLREALS